MKKLAEFIGNLKPLATDSQHTLMESSMVQNHAQAPLKLPPCDTPIFEAGYSKWLAFRDLFQAVIINHPNMSSVQKRYHLRSKAKGRNTISLHGSITLH